MYVIYHSTQIISSIEIIYNVLHIYSLLHIDYNQCIYILNLTELNYLNGFQNDPRDPHLSHQFS